MKKLFNNQKTRRAFFTLVCILSLTSISAQHGQGRYGSGYSESELTDYGMPEYHLFSYLSNPIPSVGGPLSWVDSDRWGICLDRAYFPQLTDGQTYGILIAFGSEGGVNSDCWYDMGEEFEYYNGSMYYDGLGIHNILSDGSLPISGDYSEDDIENWMDWLIGWTRCYLYNDSYEWTGSSETSLVIRIYIR